MKKQFILLFTILYILFIIPISYSNSEISDYLLLINQTHTISSEYAPKNTIDITNKVLHANKIIMEQKAGQAFLLMYNDLKQDGITNLKIDNSYRTYNTQKMLYNNRVQKYLNNGYSYNNAQEIAKTIVAFPGQSEHQTGLALDVTENGSLNADFSKSPSGIWLENNAQNYGYILRYPNDKKDITNIIFEPWHFRYVGLPHSIIMKEKNLCLEEYIELLKNNQHIYWISNDNIVYNIFYTKNLNNLNNEKIFNISNCDYTGYIVTYFTDYSKINLTNKYSISNLIITFITNTIDYYLGYSINKFS